ncbi:MAG TPA: metalloregulator ArsR/SmtB family transcription factor [Nitrospiraceae bacterium]|nr:metalloregulator ArsR/SmtB family transcription factor [Nitrospiraceae bacterium]
MKTKDLQRAAGWFHALSDETRLCILECLSHGEQCVCDLTDTLRSAQSRLSFHLKTLKDAGILNDRRDGRWVYYSLNPEVIEELESFVASLKEAGRRTRVTPKCCE